MMTSQHKYFVAGLIAGMLALYIWNRRMGGAPGPEG